MKNILSLVVYLIFVANAFAQPAPCIDPEMTPRCIDACVICDIDGFTGRNFDQNGGEAPFDFCTTRVHNISWIAFVAGTPNLTLQVTVSNCVQGGGLEIGIYESLDCEQRNMRRVSNCNTNARPGVHNFTATEPLVVGQYYYFVMDGSNDDVCNYTVNVTDGSTLIGALPDINFIDGPNGSCPGDTLTFSVPPTPGATFQEWTINGVADTTNGTTLVSPFNEPGTYDVCYTAFNVCDTIPEICKTVNIQALPTLFARDTACPGDCVLFAMFDTVICNSGITEFERRKEDGCIQKYRIEIFDLPTPSSDLELEFCFGDTVFIGGTAFTETGDYQPVLESKEGCDSIVNLKITTFLCDINGGFADDNLPCPGDTDGTLQFNLLDGAFPYQYMWEEKTGTGLTGSGTSNMPGDVVVIPGLPAGIYSVTVTDADNSRGVFVGQVFEPIPLNAEISYSNFNGFGTTCSDSAEGTITLTASGGTPGYFFLWENSTDVSSVRSELLPGNYTVSVTDSEGCEIVLFPELTAPAPITTDLQIIDPECNPDDSGVISLEDIKGGIGPFEISMNGEDFSNQNTFRNLLAGDYDFVIRDANGCELAIDTSLAEPNSLTISLNDDLEIFFGDSVQLTSQANLSDVTFAWTGDGNISCPDCPTTFVQPFENSHYNLLVTMPNRCTQTDSVFIKVIDRRRVFVPSAFSPNNDGINDFVPIFGGPEVSQILEFRVYGRWGELLFEDKNFEPNDSERGWDGRLGGKELDTGVFAWVANVAFIDGKTAIYKGDVSLLR